MKRLSDSEIQEGLARLPGWQRGGDAITRTFSPAAIRSAAAVEAWSSSPKASHTSGAQKLILSLASALPSPRSCDAASRSTSLWGGAGHERP